MVLNSLVGRLLHAALLLSAGTAAARASLMDVIFYDNRFGTIDAATGSDTTISMLPIGKAAGIAQSNGSIYVEDLANNLLTVDPVTGASRALGNTGLGLNFVVFAGGDTGLFGIDYASNLYSFNSVNGAAALIGSTGISANNGQFDTSLSFDGSSLLYTAGRPGGTDELYRINIATGLASDLGSTGVTAIAGSAIAAGELDLFQYGHSTNYLYSASDGSTSFARGAALGAQIVDGGIPVPSVSHSTPAAVPEPATLVMAGSAFLALAIWLRRKGADGQTDGK
jgi:hypothetical protein